MSLNEMFLQRRRVEGIEMMGLWHPTRRRAILHRLRPLHEGAIQWRRRESRNSTVGRSALQPQARRDALFAWIAAA